METAPPPLGSFVMLQARFHRHFGGDRRQSDYRRIPSPAWGQALREPLPKQFIGTARSQARAPSRLYPAAPGGLQKLAGTRLEAGSGLGRQANSPADAEGEAADVGDDIVEAMVDTPPVLEVDVELGELQLHVIDVVQEEHQDAHVVVPAGERGGEGDAGAVSRC